MVVLTRSQIVRIDQTTMCTKNNCYDRISCDGDMFCLMHKIKLLKAQFNEFKIKQITIKKRKKNAKYIHKLCSVASCNNMRFSKGKCAKHSGIFNCKMNGCKKLRQKGGFCVQHGGTYDRVVCKHKGCQKFNQGGGYCRTHGGGRRCKFSDHCNSTVISNVGFCKRHTHTIPTQELINKIQ